METVHHTAICIVDEVWNIYNSDITSENSRDNLTSAVPNFICVI